MKHAKANECIEVLNNRLNKQLKQCERTKLWMETAEQFKHLDIAWEVYFDYYMVGKPLHPMRYIFDLYIFEMQYKAKKAIV